MVNAKREQDRVRNTVLLVSAAAWILLVARPGGMGVLTHCPAMPLGAVPSIAMLVAMNPPLPLAAGWLLMLAAMMGPVLIPPIWEIRERSFPDRRGRAIALFLFGYGLLWMLPAVLFPWVAALARAVPAVAAGVVSCALLWQCCPWKQVCLNRCHAAAQLSAFGIKADLDALRYGLRHGFWCGGSCWALMLLPMILSNPDAHLGAMALFSLFFVSERLERPRTPEWRWRGFGKLLRLAAGQFRLKTWRIGRMVIVRGA